MAGLHRSEYGVYRLTFYFDQEKICRSTGTKDPAEAKQLQARVERTLDLIAGGHLTLPHQLTRDELWQILRTGGKVPVKTQLIAPQSLEEICQKYLASYPSGTKEENTLKTERYHTNHFLRIFGKDTDFRVISSDDVTEYVRKRQTERGVHGQRVRNVTINKELQTFTAIWKYANSQGWVQGDNPLEQVRRPRSSEKLPFMTLEEVRKRVERGALTDGEIARLWECVFLREEEISAFLEHVKQVVPSLPPRFRFIYPALVFCAYTGARRSEVLRCQIDDIGENVLLREKKKSQAHEFTYRQVSMHPELQRVLDDWLSDHPGGQLLFCKSGGQAIDEKTAREACVAAKKNSCWSVLRGYHVLRHSFASNLARNGIDQRQIDEFMGHQTEASRRRYRHLFPEDGEQAINTLNYAHVENLQPGPFRIVG